MNILTRLRSALLATAPSAGRTLIVSQPAAKAAREQTRTSKPSSSAATTSPASQPLATGARRNAAAADATRRQAAIDASWRRAHERASGKLAIRASHGWDQAYARARAQRSSDSKIQARPGK